MNGHAKPFTATINTYSSSRCSIDLYYCKQKNQNPRNSKAETNTCAKVSPPAPARLLLGTYQDLDGPFPRGSSASSAAAAMSRSRAAAGSRRGGWGCGDFNRSHRSPSARVRASADEAEAVVVTLCLCSVCWLHNSSSEFITAQMLLQSVQETVENHGLHRRTSETSSLSLGDQIDRHKVNLGSHRLPPFLCLHVLVRSLR